MKWTLWPRYSAPVTRKALVRYMAFDLETTGLDTQNDEIIELGFALYDTAYEAPIVMRSFFVVPKAPISQETTDITGITQNHVDCFGVPLDEAVFEMLNIMDIHDTSFLVGHNCIDFDYPMLKSNCSRAGLVLPQIDLVDTRIDLPFPRPPKNLSLIYLAAEKGFVNPFPHRALFDAMTCAKLLSYYDVEKVLASSQSPLVEIRADVRYEQRDLAKKAGYNWDPERKIWAKRIRQNRLQEEEQKAQFPVLRLS